MRKIDETKKTLKKRVDVVQAGLSELKKIQSQHSHADKSKALSVEAYATVFEQVTDSVSIVDVETKKYLHANPVLCKMLGYTVDEIVGLSITDTHPRHELPFLMPGFEAMACGDVTLAVNVPCLTKDGLVIHTNISSTRTHISGRLCLIAFFTEATKFKPKHHILGESEKHLKLILEQSFDGINISEYDINANKRRLVLCNNRFAQMAGRSREELMAAENVNDFIVFHSFKDDVKKCRESILQEKPYRGQASWIRPDGKENYFDWVAAPTKIGDRYYVVGIDRDITEIKKADEKLNRAEVQYRTLVEQIPAVTYTAALNETSTTLYISPQIEDILGITPADYKKDPELWVERLHPKDRERVLKELKNSHASGTPFCFEYRMLAANGKVVWVRDEATIVKDECGEELFLQGVMFNITGLKKAEEMLRRTQETLRKGKDKLEDRITRRTSDLEKLNMQLRGEIAIRKQTQAKLLKYQDQLRSLASELSLAEERTRKHIATDVHDHIGQNLAIAKMKLQLLAESVPSAEDRLLTQQINDIIAATIDSTRTLTFEISPPVLYELGFEAAVEWLLRKSRKEHGLIASFQTDGRSKPLDENVRVFLFQAVRELLINVSKHAGAKKVTVSVFRLNDHVQVSVADDGVGFNMQKMDSLSPSPGGFGLFSIRERLSYIRGRLNIDSTKGRGARIIITAPLAVEQRDAGGKRR